MLTGVIRVSFNNNNMTASNGARYVLTGTIQAGAPEAPFKKEGTSGFSCRDGDEVDVAKALEGLAKVIANGAADLDFLTVSLLRQT